MKRAYTYIFGLISGVILMLGVFLLHLDNSYIMLDEDCQIDNVGFLKKGTKLKIEKGFSEGFTQYSLLLNFSDAGKTKLLKESKWNLIIPYWLRPIGDNAEIEGDMYFKLISIGSFFNISKEKKDEFLIKIDSLRKTDSISKKDKELISIVDLLIKYDLIDKPYFHLKLDSTKITTVYTSLAEYKKILSFNRQELINEGKRIKLKLSGQEISRDIFYANEILEINKIDGKTYWRK